MISGTYFCLRLSRPQGHSGAGVQFCTLLPTFRRNLLPQFSGHKIYSIVKKAARSSERPVTIYQSTQHPITEESYGRVMMNLEVYLSNGRGPLQVLNVTEVLRKTRKKKEGQEGRKR
jgi:hypothetical protein